MTMASVTVLVAMSVPVFVTAVFLLLLLVFRGEHFRVVHLEPRVPGDARHGRHGSELVDDVSRNEVYVVVAQLDHCITHALASHQIQLRFVNPRDTL